MFEKVNPSHPDKLCDRIAGAIVDMAYAAVPDPRIAVEVLLGHGICHIIAETDISLPLYEIEAAVERIAGKVAVDYVEVAQDRHLAQNQEQGFRCGDNGIFKGMPVTTEQKALTRMAKDIYDKYGSDGKYILDVDRLIWQIVSQVAACMERTCPRRMYLSISGHGSKRRKPESQ